MFGLQTRDVVPHVRPKVFHLIRAESVVFGIPLLGLREALTVGGIPFSLESELVVQKLVKENLGDNLVFVTVVAQACVAAYGLERIDQVDGALFNPPFQPFSLPSQPFSLPLQPPSLPSYALSLKSQQHSSHAVSDVDAP